MKLSRIIISMTIPLFLIMLFASILTTKQYLLISKGVYYNHSLITFDHDKAADRIMGYLNYRYDELQYEFSDGEDAFRQTEIDHMVDVKNLYTGLRITALVSLVIGGGLLYFIYTKDKKEFYSTLKQMFVWPMFFVMMLGGYMLVDFNAAFTMFHKIFFTNDDWILYSTDTLILILPQNFWLVSGMIIIALFSISLGFIYYISNKKLKKLP